MWFCSFEDKLFWFTLFFLVIAGFDLPKFRILTNLLIKFGYFLHAALQMSMQDSAGEPSSQSDVNKVLEDQSFLSSILESVCAIYLVLLYFTYKWCCCGLDTLSCLQLPGVDPNDPSVKELLASLKNQSKEKDEGGPSKEDKWRCGTLFALSLVDLSRNIWLFCCWQRDIFSALLFILGRWYKNRCRIGFLESIRS